MKTIKGIVGGLIGGLIASLPWILVGVFLNFVWSFLAALIAFGVVFGYNLFGGEKDKKYPFIIAITTIVVVVIVTLVIEPLVFGYKEIGVPPSLEFLEFLYSIPSYRTEVIKSLFIGVAFAAIGISSIVRNAYAEVKANEYQDGERIQVIFDDEEEENTVE